jgi:hexosaminidase
MYKMNVLHFHVSEECFRIESKVHPSLHTADCTFSGRSNNEFYTQEDIKKIVSFAKLRGIRVIPEFDMPGHAGGFCMGLKSEGIQCCGGQIQDDSEGKSVALISAVLDEMMELFPDDVLHIGCDETGSAAPCTLENTKSFEEKVIQHLLSKKKTVMGWEEILFKTEAAKISQDIIIDAWARSSWQQAAQAGHPVVDSENGHFYLDNLGADHTAAGMWLDITKGETNSTMRSLLLGAESSMWQDQYVPDRVASCLFQSPERDEDFANSTSSMIWPRNAIAAGSFWRYSPRLSGDDELFASILARASASLEDRGIGSCHCTTPSSTGCQQQSYCGQTWCSDETLV